MSSSVDSMRRDGAVSFEGGQDAGRSPSIIARNQVALATNASMRGGFISPRPVWIKKTFSFSSDSVQSGFKSGGRFQHVGFFDGSGSPMLLSSHGGRLFRADLITNVITEITPVTIGDTTTTAGFVIPAVGATVNVSVTSSYRMAPAAGSGVALDDVPLTIGGAVLQLVSVNSATGITVQNNIVANVGVAMAPGAVVEFSYLDVNSPSQELGWSVQAENYWIYQDNQSAAIIFNGSSARRSVAAQKEVPVGNVMAYTMGRLVVALPDRTSFRVGDLVFGPSGTALNGYRDAMLKFSENDFLNDGGDFQARVFGAPSGYGPITAMKPISMMDSQLGQGPLLVGTPYVIFTLNLPFDRTIWKDLSNPLQTVTPVIGPVGQNSTVNVNTDLWYRAADFGIHSFVLARRDFTTWGNTPQSTELGETLYHDTTWLNEFASAVFFDNRILMTCSPNPSTRGVWNRGVVSLDFDLVSSLRTRANPAWEGVWSGLRVLQLVTGTFNNKAHCYAYALNDDDEIEIWELSSDAIYDNNSQRVTMNIDFPSYNCGDGFNFKKLETGEIFVDDVRGQVDITVKYRSDQNPCWQTWDTFSFCASDQDCGPFNCTGPVSYREQFRSKLKLHQPADTFDTINGRKYRTGFEFQPRLEIVGHCQVKQFRLLAFDEPEAPFGPRPTNIV